MPNQKGVTLWFTGLSGSGKTTIAVAVEKALKANGYRVERLDGDEIRQYLCRDLGFSKEDRDENIRRVSYVAGLLTKNDIITLCCFVSPYREARKEARALSKKFVEIYVNTPFFSLMHGISLEMIVSKHSRDKLQGIKVKNNVIAYTHSKKEIDAYNYLYGIEDKKIKPIGIPRHSEKWLKQVINKAGKFDLPKDNYIFVVSRPANSNYFPYDPKESKASIINEILEIAQELNCKIVVRLHPKESDEGLYEKILGKHSYGVGWCYSLSHPFVLGINSIFCVTFFFRGCNRYGRFGSACY